MALKIGLSVLGVIAVFLLYVGMKSPDYFVSREITINAPAEKIFPYLNDQKLAEQWGPWLDIDPQAKMNYSGPDSGPGAKASWDSTGQLGTGSATIVESIENQKVGIALEYTKPMTMTQRADYLIKPAGDKSVVVWQVTGKNNFISRLMCTFMDMDKMVGGMFEKGLSKLKTVVEK